MIENLFNRTLDASQPGKSLLKHFQDNDVDWMHACGGKGRCTTCKVVVRHGIGHLEPLTPAEQRYMSEGALQQGERLACQAIVNGDVIVVAPREYHLPHMRYSDEG